MEDMSSVLNKHLHQNSTTTEEAALRLAYLFVEPPLRPPFANPSIQGPAGLGEDWLKPTPGSCGGSKSQFDMFGFLCLLSSSTEP